MKVFKTTNLREERFGRLADFLVLDLLNENVFLAGGAMRTLLLDEDIKDYDVFFRKQYEVPEARQKLVDEGFELVFECPEGKLFTYRKEWEPGPCGEPHIMKVQLICNEFGGPEDIINTFDFNAGRCAMDNRNVYITDQFIRDVMTKTLSLWRLTYPVATLKRLVKYANKGYNINQVSKEIVGELYNAGFNNVLWDDEQLRVYID